MYLTSRKTHRRTKGKNQGKVRERRIRYSNRSAIFYQRKFLNFIQTKESAISFKKMELSYKKTDKIPGNAPNEEIQEDFEVVYKIYEEMAEK